MIAECKKKTKCRNNRTMTNIPKHHAEKEWESCYWNWNRVGFLICWNTISIYEELKWRQEIICFHVCRWSDIVITIRIEFGSQVILQRFLKRCFLVSWCPKVSNKCLILQFHLIKSSIKGLFFRNKHFIHKNCWISFLLAGFTWSRSLNCIELYQIIF